MKEVPERAWKLFQDLHPEKSVMMYDKRDFGDLRKIEEHFHAFALYVRDYVERHLRVGLKQEEDQKEQSTNGV